MLLIIKSWQVCVYAALDPTILLNIYRQNTKWSGSELDGNIMWTLFFIIWYFSKPRQRPWFANSTVLQRPWINQWTTMSNCETYLSIFKNPTNAHQQLSPKNTNSHLQVFLGPGNVLSSLHASSHLHNCTRWNLYYFCLQKREAWSGLV